MWSLRLRMLSQLVVLLATIFWTSGALMKNMDESSVAAKLWLAVVLVAALWLLIQRDTYLPFLGMSAFPPAAIMSERIPERADTEIMLPLEGVADGSRVIYWGAGPDKKTVVSNPWDAYGDYGNTGVAVVRNGVAKIRFQCPTQYKVPMSWKALEKHIHYRVCCARTGLLGPVETKWVAC